MRVFRFVPAFILLFYVSGFAQSTPPPAFSAEAIDNTVDPCVDFYQYACGNWLKRAEIPADQTSWASFVEIRERNAATMRQILQKAATESAGRDAITQKIGDYYGSCMDEKMVEAKGLNPLQPELDRITGAKDKAALIEAIGPNPLFNFYSSPDLHSANDVIAYIDQGGLSLPDRDYYLKDDPKMAEARKSLVQYATQMFTLAGQSTPHAGESAQTVLRIETALAKASMDRTARRDPKNRDHKMTRDEALGLAPNFSLNRYFDAVGAPGFSSLNVTNPDFFKQVNGVLESESLDALRTYVSWHLLDGAAPWLPQQFVDANFKLQQALTGQSEIKPRWKRCVSSTAHAEDGGCAGNESGPGHPQPALDDPRDEKAGQSQTGGNPQQDRLSRRLARLQFAQDCA